MTGHFRWSPPGGAEVKIMLKRYMPKLLVPNIDCPWSTPTFGSTPTWNSTTSYSITSVAKAVITTKMSPTKPPLINSTILLHATTTKAETSTDEPPETYRREPLPISEQIDVYNSEESIEQLVSHCGELKCLSTLVLYFSLLFLVLYDFSWHLQI